MTHRPILALALLGTALCFSTESFGQATGSAPDGAVPDTPKGFTSQYQPVFSAWATNDQSKLNVRLDLFAIPKEWFVVTFGADQGAELAESYFDQFEDFRSTVKRRFAGAEEYGKKRAPQAFGGGAAKIFVETKSRKNMQPRGGAKPVPSSLRELPPVQWFAIQSYVRVQNTELETSSWMDSFVYIDGRFRFLGGGAYPFWDPAELVDYCGKPGERMIRQLTTKVEPQLPDAAQVTGTVRAGLTIAKDGSVKAVEIWQGPTELVDAARKAFEQWRYAPFTRCGKQVEVQLPEHIKFTRP